VATIITRAEAHRARERERMKDPAYREAKNARNREWAREQRKDPVVREAHNAQERERMKDPAYREAKNARQRGSGRQRERRKDPAVREAYNAQARERQRCQRKDPIVREALNTQARERYHRKNPAYREAQNARRRGRRRKNAAPHSAMRRARKRHNTVATNKTEKAQIALLYRERDRLTRETGVKWHVDHVVPISKGGAHEIRNLQLMPAIKNLRKHVQRAKVTKVMCLINALIISGHRGPYTPDIESAAT
jgi:HNH endonuclease